MIRFVFPETGQDLGQKPVSDAQFFVQNGFEYGDKSEKEVNDMLYDVIDGLGKNSTSVTESENHFDVLYSLVGVFHELPHGIQSKVSSAVTGGINGLLLVAEQAISARTADPTSRACAEEVDLCRMAAKMYAFLVCSIMRVNEEGEIRRINLKASAGKGGAKAKAKALLQQQTIKEPMLMALKSMIESNAVFGLWSMNTPEQKLGDICFQTASTLLENPENVKAASTREVVFTLFAAVITRFQLADRASSNLVQVLMSFDAMSTHMPQLFLLLSDKYKNTSLLADFVAEIGRLDSKLLAKDNAGAKNIAAFLAAMGSDAPTLVLPHLGALLEHLSDDAYVIRNGIIQLCGHLMCVEGISLVAVEDEVDMTHEHQQPQQPQQQQRRAVLALREGNVNDEAAEHKAENDGDLSKESSIDDTPALEWTKLNRTSWNSLFALMCTRVHDVTSFTRSKVMQTFIRLVESHQLPQTQLISTAQLACDRLQDKAAAVRKQAVQLLAACLEHNPVGPSLRLAPFQAKLREMGTRMADIVAKKKEELELAKEGGQASGGAVAVLAAKEEEEERDTLRKKLQIYHAFCKFITCVEEAVPQVCALLSSKTLSDVMCAIKFFSTARQFRVTNSGMGVRKMMLLVWSRDTAIREEVIKAFERLYLGAAASEEEDFDYGGEAESKNQTATHRTCMNLIRLTTGITLAEFTSFEELMFRMMKSDKVPENVVEQLWAMFSSSSIDVPTKTRKGALVVLGFLAKADPQLVMDNLTHIVSIGLGPRAQTDPGLARAACIALQHVAVELPQPTVDAIMSQLRCVLEEHSSDPRWYNAAQEAVSTIFCLAKHPDGVVEAVIRKMAARAGLIDGEEGEEEEKKKASMVDLAHLLFVVGHTSVKMLAFLEKLELVTKKKVAAKPKAETPEGAESSIEQDLAVNAAEDYQIELLRDHAEQSLVASTSTTQQSTGFSSPVGLLGLFAPVIKKILTAPKQFSLNELQTAATLALCKFMAVSSAFCESHLQLLFTLLEKSGNTGIRNNILVAVGDISVRFPNLIEPWTKHVYARLDDKNDHVRKNALMVLTHLILNDMVKAKGPVVAIAKCLRDPTEAVANLAGLFFQELSRKGENPVYNVLPDVISRLSTDAAVTQDAFRYVLKFLLQYVNKDRQVDGLVDKLCHRFHAVHVDTKQMQAAAKKSKQEEGEGEQKQQQEQEQQKKKESSSSSSADDAIVQCRNMAYCLSELNLTQNAFSKFMSLYPLYANKLGDEVVFEYLQLVLAKGKKVAKADAKSNVEEFEQKLQEGHDKQIDDIYADTHAKGAKRVKVDSADVLEEIARLKLQNEEQARERKEAKMTKGRRGRKKAPTAAVAMPTPAQEGAKAATVTKAKPAPKRRAPVRRKPRKKVVESSSESESSSSESSESSQYESD